jgi:hypothetical protein
MHTLNKSVHQKCPKLAVIVPLQNQLPLEPYLICQRKVVSTVLSLTMVMVTQALHLMTQTQAGQVLLVPFMDRASLIKNQCQTLAVMWNQHGKRNVNSAVNTTPK